MFESMKDSGISHYMCDELKSQEKIHLYSPIKEKNIKNFKYLKKDVQIDFNYEDFDNIFKCIKFLNNNYKSISISINDKEKFNKFIASINLDYVDMNKIIIYQGLSKTTLEDYIYFESILYTIIKPALNLSPLEKYIYVYNIVKKYKEYKDCPYDDRYSRTLYRVLFNNYIVCAGFSKFLSDLLNKLDINNYYLSLMVDDDKKHEFYRTNHARLFVNLKDEKYNINGFYLSDSTWDNDMVRDLYTYMLFTNAKNNLAKKIQYDDRFLVFNVKNLDEYYSMFNELKNRFKLDNFDILDYILNILKYLEPNLYTDINNKYNLSKKKHQKIMLEELGDFIVSKVNNEINEKKLWEAIRVIYEKSYGFKNKTNLEEELKKVKKYNEKRLKEHYYNNVDEKTVKEIKYKNKYFF